MSVEIRSPFPVHALPRAWGWLQAFKSRVADDFGPKDAAEWIDRTVNSQAKTWGVYRDGELGGMISFERISPWLGTAHCVFRKDFWGRTTTRPAVRAALLEIFSSGIGKLTFLVFADNREVRRLLMEFGAEVEAVYRRHTIRGGKLVTMKALAIFGDAFKEQFDANGNPSRDAGLELSGRGGLDTGGRSVQPEERTDEHDHASVVPGTAGPSIPTPGVQHGPDEQPEQGSSAD